MFPSYNVLTTSSGGYAEVALDKCQTLMGYAKDVPEVKFPSSSTSFWILDLYSTRPKKIERKIMLILGIFESIH